MRHLAPERIADSMQPAPERLAGEKGKQTSPISETDNEGAREQKSIGTFLSLIPHGPRRGYKILQNTRLSPTNRHSHLLMEFQLYIRHYSCSVQDRAVLQANGLGRV